MLLLIKLLSIKSSLYVHCLILSSSGTSTVDPTALHQLRDVNLQLGDANADISMSPDGTTLLIADNQVNRAFLLNTNTGRS